MTTQCGFCRKSPSKQRNKTVILVALQHVGLSDESLYLLPFFYVAGLDRPRDCRFCDYQHCTPIKQIYKLHRM